MYEQVKKPKESKSRAVANSVVQMIDNRKKGFGFVDNRQASVAQGILKASESFNASKQQQPIQEKQKQSKNETYIFSSY